MRTFLVLSALAAVASGAAGKTRESRGVIYNTIQPQVQYQYSNAHAQSQVYAAPQFAQVSHGTQQYHVGGGHQHVQAPVGYSYTAGGTGLGHGQGLISPGPIGAPIAPSLGYPEEISKSVYVFSAPPDPFDNVQPQVVKTFPAQKRKHYQVVFINAPNPPLPVQHTVELPTPPELKTQVYVLVKKPQKAPPLKVIPAKVPVHKPEVYFIRYQNNKGQGGIPVGGPSGGSIISDGGYGGGGLVETTGPSSEYGAPVDAGHVHYGAPVLTTGYEGSHNDVGYGAPTEGPVSISGGGYGVPSPDYGAPPGSEYGAPTHDYGVPSSSEGGSYGAPAESYGSPSADYESRGGRHGSPGGDPRDMYSDYSRLNALYTYAPQYSKRRMDNTKWKPIGRHGGRHVGRHVKITGI